MKELRVIIGFVIIFSYVLCLFSCNTVVEEVSDVSTESANDVVENEALVVAYSGFSGLFNPFYAQTSADIDVVRVTSVPLLTVSRQGEFVANGISGEINSYNNQAYEYSGIASYKVTNVTDGCYIYEFEIRDDVVFSDGVKLTVDDVIFTMYVLADPMYDGPHPFGRSSIAGMDEYRNGNEASIWGIERTSDFSFRVTVTENDNSFLLNMSFYIAPLHYYGSDDMYDYDNNSFGFTKGDLSSIKTKSAHPLGAGPYIFKRHVGNTIIFERNVNYYKGVPRIEELQFMEISTFDVVNYLERDVVDIVYGGFDIETFDEIIILNGGKLIDDTFYTLLCESNVYGYVGISAENVKVGSDKSSYESKSLRKAFATLMSFYREKSIVDYYGELAKIVDCPPYINKYEGSMAYSVDIGGKDIFTSDMTQEQRYDAMLDTVLSFFKAAGYSFDENNVAVHAPEGASLIYEVIITGGGVGDHPSYQMFNNVKDTLATIGITLNIIDVKNSNELWLNVDSGTCQMWSAAWEFTSNTNMYSLYHSSNIDGVMGSNGQNDYHIDDTELDYLLLLPILHLVDDESSAIKKQCYDIILDWGVEIPLYQRFDALVINTSSIDINSFSGDYTASYDWISDIHNISMYCG